MLILSPGCCCVSPCPGCSGSIPDSLSVTVAGVVHDLPEDVCCDDFNDTWVLTWNEANCWWIYSGTFCSIYTAIVRAAITDNGDGTYTLRVTVSVNHGFVTVLAFEQTYGEAIDCENLEEEDIAFDQYSSGGGSFDNCDASAATCLVSAA